MVKSALRQACGAFSWLILMWKGQPSVGLGSWVSRDRKHLCVLVVCLALASVAVMRHHNQEQLWGGKGWFGLHSHIDHGGRNSSRAHGRTLLTGAFPGLLRPFTHPLALPSVYWALPHQLSNQENVPQPNLMKAIPQRKFLSP